MTIDQSSLLQCLSPTCWSKGIIIKIFYVFINLNIQIVNIVYFYLDD